MLYSFSDHVLDVGRRELRRGSDSVAVEPQVFDLLIYLIQNRDHVVSKDDLIASVWGGRIVSESTLTSRINAARKALGDSGEEQRLIRTVARKGIRFLADVREVVEPPSELPARAPSGGITEEEHHRPSIAVLPFTNMSGDPEQEYFADGIVEDITAALSRVRSLLVISRNSSFTYKGKVVDARQVGRDLGVRYVLEGSVRRAANKLRIGAHLVEATTGTQVWNGRYDGEVTDVFELQDRVAEAVVGAIEPTITLSEIERARRKRPESLSAYDSVMRALPAIWSQGAEATTEGLSWAEQAISLDPGYALPRALAAWCYAQRPTYLRVQSLRREDIEADRTKASALARQAVRLDNSDPLVLTFAGAAHSLTREYPLAESLIEKALAMDPNSAWAWTRSGWINVYLRKTSRAIEHFERSIRLSPLDPMMFNIFAGIGAAHLNAENYAEAARWIERGLREQPDAIWLNRTLAVAYFHSGHVDAAQTALGVLLRSFPGLTIAGLVESAAFSDFSRGKFEEAFRELGLPG